jgi:preprotein translocase subunit SecF
VIGPEIGADLRRQEVLSTGGASGGMLLYLGWRFRLRYGVTAVIAMFHDAVITLGLFSLLDQEISLTAVAALLTLIGYSMNDTIVVFDRIRENWRIGSRESFAETVNRSINQTLSRTVLTSGLTLLSALALFFFGGPVLHGVSLALVIGIVVGTFSSVFIASPILLPWENAAARRASLRVLLETRGAR